MATFATVSPFNVDNTILYSFCSVWLENPEQLHSEHGCRLATRLACVDLLEFAQTCHQMSGIRLNTLVDFIGG